MKERKFQITYIKWFPYLFHGLGVSQEIKTPLLSSLERSCPIPVASLLFHYLRWEIRNEIKPKKNVNHFYHDWIVVHYSKLCCNAGSLIGLLDKSFSERCTQDYCILVITDNFYFHS